MEQKPAAPAPAATGAATSGGGGGSTPPSAFPRLPVSSSSSFPTPTTMTTSTMTASSSSSLSTSTVPRGGLSMGVPAQNPARTSQPFTTFGPSPPSSSLHQQNPHQFVSMHRHPDPSLSSTSQARAIGSFGSLGAGQLRPNSVPVSQSPRLAQTPLRPVPPPSNPSFNSQRMATQGISRPVSSLPPPSSLTQLHMQASSMPPPSSSSYRPVQGQHRPFQAPLQHLQAPLQNPFPAQHSNPNPNRVPLSGPIGPLINADLAEHGDKIVSKRSIHELFSQIDPSENVEKDVEDILIEVAEDFVESLTTFACSLAKHRKSSTLEAKDILLHAERNWNITLPGFSGDDLKIYKKPNVNDIHRERLALIKKSMGDHRRTNAGGTSQPTTLTKL